MHGESYVDSVESQLPEWEQRVETVVAVLRNIVHNYAQYDDAVTGSPTLTLKSVALDTAKPNKLAHLDLLGQDGKAIPKTDGSDIAEEDAVQVANLRITSGADDDYRTALTIETRPPSVKGYDDRSLTIDELDGAILDLQRYETALVGKAPEE